MNPSEGQYHPKSGDAFVNLGNRELNIALSSIDLLRLPGAFHRMVP